jgi:hypothetical protein
MIYTVSQKITSPSVQPGFPTGMEGSTTPSQKLRTLCACQTTAEQEYHVIGSMWQAMNICRRPVDELAGLLKLALQRIQNSM